MTDQEAAKRLMRLAKAIMADESPRQSRRPRRAAIGPYEFLLDF